MACRGLVEPQEGIGCAAEGGLGGESVRQRKCSLDVLVEHAGAPDHDDPNGYQGAECDE